MTVRFTILGCGSSLGIPRVDGYFGKCNPRLKENYRSRCSALITFNNIPYLENILMILFFNIIFKSLNFFF